MSYPPGCTQADYDRYTMSLEEEPLYCRICDTTAPADECCRCEPEPAEDDE